MSLEIEIEAESSERIDRYLAEQLPQQSRSQIQKWIEQGDVCLNGQPCLSKKLLVHPGDRIQLHIPVSKPLSLEPEDIPLDILFEDEEFLILNKPAGLVVHPSAGHETGTLVQALLAHCPNLPGIGGIQRPGIVHRLDKDTTGALMVAKTDHAHQHLQAQLKAKTASREYLGIVYGSPRDAQGTIDQPLGRNPGDRKKMTIVAEDRGGRRAVTHWQVQERLGNFTLMQFRLETGRTHQIRVHSTHLGHPIVGDPVYGAGRSVGVKLSGQALHAWRLRVQHPRTGEWIEAVAPLPSDFETLLAVIRRRVDNSTPGSVSR